MNQEESKNAANANVDLNVAIASFDGHNRYAEEEGMGVRDPLTGRFASHDLYGGDLSLNVVFSTESVLSKRETYLAGGTLKYVDMDFITILVPGDTNVKIHTPVTPFYEWRFRKEYAAFKHGKEATGVGTPLALWPEVRPSQVSELKHLGINTIEQLANLSDSASGNLRAFFSLKQKAQQFLSDAKDKHAASNTRAQLAEQEERHKAEMKALEDRMAAMLEQVMAAKEAKDDKEPKEGKRGKAGE